jgi:hypothetical protein
VLLRNALRRRPLSSRTWGAAAISLALPFLASCGSDVEIDVPDLSADDRAACADLLDALPDTLFGQPREPVTPHDAPGAAWGDPAVVLTCGVDRPEEYDETAPCIEVRNVGWFVPASQLEDVGSEAEATVLTHTPYVELLVPTHYRTIGVDKALNDLAPAITQTLTEGKPCF